MKRKKYIDILKCVSAFCIVILHLNISSAHLVRNFLTPLHDSISFASHQVLYVAVSVFIVLTGCGLFSSGRTGYKDMWPRIRKILLCILIFNSFFELVRILVQHESITPTEYLTDLINGSSMSHMWFLNSLLGLYLVTPLIGAFIQNRPAKEVVLLTFVCFFFSSLFPLTAGLIGFTYTPFFPVTGMFVTLSLTGYLIESCSDEVARRFLIPGLIVSILALAAIFYIAFTTGAIILQDHPLSAIAATCIVFSVKGVVSSDKESGKLLITVSRCTLGIYIIHPLFIHFLQSFAGFNPHLHMPLLTIPLTALFIFAVSFAVTYAYLFIKRKLFSHK